MGGSDYAEEKKDEQAPKTEVDLPVPVPPPADATVPSNEPQTEEKKEG